MAPKNRRRLSTILEPGRDPRDPFEVHAIWQYHFRVDDRVVHWIGPSFNQPGRVLSTTGGSDQAYLVVKVPGGKVWTGIGQAWRYAATSIYVFRILHERPSWRGNRSVLNPGAREIVAERLLSFEVRQ